MKGIEMQSSDEASMIELSALADGACSEAETARALALWRQSESARRTWHAYHVIGDVLRSPDLAVAGSAEVFLQKLRVRLADEPVPLAPSVTKADQEEADASGRLAQVRSIHRRWAAPMAVAASFMALTFFSLSAFKPAGQGGGDLGSLSAPAAGMSPAMSFQPDTTGLISLDDASNVPACEDTVGVQAHGSDEVGGRSFDRPFTPPSSRVRPAAFAHGTQTRAACMTQC
jgi:sigma-E factor negative regulatory protein RseA